MAEIVDTVEELPERIQARVRDVAPDLGGFRAAFKTSFKPNATIPLIWLVLADRGILLCSTHRTRGVWAVLEREDIDTIVVEKGIVGAGWVKITPRKLGENDHVLPLPDRLDEKEVKPLLATWQAS